MIPLMSVRAQAGVVVRHRDPGDDEFVARLARTAFGEYDRDASQRTLASARARGAVTLVAARGDDPVGFAVVQFGRDAGFLQAIAVKREHRGTGIGRRLLIAAERLTAAHGAAELRLCTAESNLAALDLFLKRGFVIDRDKRTQYPRGQPVCTLKKRLDARR
jgi:ribosomal protein S18 acetylase RimI-like enzyme